MTTKVAAVLITQIVVASLAVNVLAQNDPTLERVRALGLESLPAPVPTYFSPDARTRAEVVQRRVRNAVRWFERRYRASVPLTVAILNEEHWPALGRGPYGGMFSSAAPRVVAVPAFPERGLLVKFFQTTHAAASSPEVEQAWTGADVSHERAVDHVYDAMVLHEVGHALVNGALGFSWSRHWFNEFMATYMAHMLLRREPATIKMWKAVSLDVVYGSKPSVQTLDEFNRLYGSGRQRPETYGWFYSQINLGVTKVRERKRKGDFFKELRAAGLDKDPSILSGELIDRLERIAPGLREWAAQRDLIANQAFLHFRRDGILTDSLGNQVPPRVTSASARRLRSDQKSAEQLINQELKKEFSPEFINRIDDIIIFNPLTQTELRQICRLLVDDVNQALIHKNVHIAVDERVVDWLLKKAEEEANSGARPLRRAIQRHIEDELSEFMIRHKDNVPERIDFTMNGDQVALIAAPKDVDLIAN